MNELERQSLEIELDTMKLSLRRMDLQQAEALARYEEEVGRVEKSRAATLKRVDEIQARLDA